MESNNTIFYDIAKSAQRIDDILNAGNSNFSDADKIPLRSSLTYTNGYYVNISALFIDIVGSSDMTDAHKRPTLAKMYRSFISECVAIMNSREICKEVNIHGDCVWGVFEILSKTDIDNVFSVTSQLNSMLSLLNYKLRNKSYSPISVGIGVDYGRALMIQAGYSGSKINDVIWMGDVVNSASNLCNKAGRNGRKPIIVSGSVYINLNDHNKSLLSSYFDISDLNSLYECNVIDPNMQEWISKNCPQNTSFLDWIFG